MRCSGRGVGRAGGASRAGVRRRGGGQEEAIEQRTQVLTSFLLPETMGRQFRLCEATPQRWRLVLDGYSLQRCMACIGRGDVDHVVPETGALGGVGLAVPISMPR